MKCTKLITDCHSEVHLYLSPQCHRPGVLPLRARATVTGPGGPGRAGGRVIRRRGGGDLRREKHQQLVRNKFDSVVRSTAVTLRSRHL
eukprot:759631-Hanusia_phi.AAC.1